MGVLRVLGTTAYDWKLRQVSNNFLESFDESGEAAACIGMCGLCTKALTGFSDEFLKVWQVYSMDWCVWPMYRSFNKVWRNFYEAAGYRQMYGRSMSTYWEPLKVLVSFSDFLTSYGKPNKTTMWPLYRSFGKTWRNIYQVASCWQACRGSIGMYGEPPKASANFIDFLTTYGESGKVTMWSLYRSFGKAWRIIYQRTGCQQVCRGFYKDIWRISRSFGEFAISFSMILQDQRVCWIVDNAKQEKWQLK